MRHDHVHTTAGRIDQPMFEQLEGRALFSAGSLVAPLMSDPPAGVGPAAGVEVPMTHAVSAKSYSMMSLLGYDRRGSSRNYNVAYWFDNNGLTDSGNTTTNIQVATKTRKLDGKNTNTVSVPSGSVQAGGAFFADSSGMYLLASDMATPGGATHIRLHGLKISPAKMKTGQGFSDAGTFDGTFTVVINGKEYSGTLSGRVKSVLRVLGETTTVTRAGTFKTVQMQWDMTLTGTVTLNFEGTKINYDLNSTNSTNIRAAQGVGIVHSQTSVDNRYLSAFVPSVRTAFTTTFDLLSYRL